MIANVSSRYRRRRSKSSIHSDIGTYGSGSGRARPGRSRSRRRLDRDVRSLGLGRRPRRRRAAPFADGFLRLRPPRVPRRVLALRLASSRLAGSSARRAQLASASPLTSISGSATWLLRRPIGGTSALAAGILAGGLGVASPARSLAAAAGFALVRRATAPRALLLRRPSAAASAPSSPLAPRRPAGDSSSSAPSAASAPPRPRVGLGSAPRLGFSASGSVASASSASAFFALGAASASRPRPRT